jgi:hypothetical protein
MYPETITRLLELMPSGLSNEQLLWRLVLRGCANAAATLGGSSLTPAELRGELAIEGEGLRNVAGLFYPPIPGSRRELERDLVLCGKVLERFDHFWTT